MPSKLVTAAIIAFGLAELAVAGYAATTDVGPEYAAYYVDRTTGCLPRDVPGTYTLGTTLQPVLGQPRKPFDDILVCGFENSTKTGTWLRGNDARLRFALGDIPRSDLVLKLEAHANSSIRHPVHELTIVANGQKVGTATFDSEEERQVEMRIPASVLSASGMLELELTMARQPYLEPEDRYSRLHSLLLKSLWLGPA